MFNINFKELSEIEPIQKNSIITIIFVFFISYLQLFLFKENFEVLSLLTKIFLAISVAIIWIVIQIPSHLFIIARRVIKKPNLKENFPLGLLILPFGFSLLIWMSLITYLCYEMSFNLKTFIRVSLIFMLIKTLFNFIFWLIIKEKS